MFTFRVVSAIKVCLALEEVSGVQGMENTLWQADLIAEDTTCVSYGFPLESSIESSAPRYRNGEM